VPKDGFPRLHKLNWTTTTTNRLPYYKDRYKEVTKQLSTQNWSALDQMNVDESWSYFVTINEDAMSQYITIIRTWNA